MNTNCESVQPEEAAENLSVDSSKAEEAETHRVPKKVTLKSSDGEAFEVEETAVLESELIKNLIQGGCGNEEIPLDNVTGAILAEVIEYCKKHAGGNYNKNDEELKKWDAEFMEQVDWDTVYFYLLAANDMNVEGLLDLASQRVANMIKGKQPEEIRQILNINNDLDPTQEAEFRDKYSWAFE